MYIFCSVPIDSSEENVKRIVCTERGKANVWALSLWELPLVQIVGTVGTVRIGSLESEQPSSPSKPVGL